MPNHVATLDAIDGTGLSEKQRVETVKAANKLIRRLEKPVETILQQLSIVGSDLSVRSPAYISAAYRVGRASNFFRFTVV